MSDHHTEPTGSLPFPDFSIDDQVRLARGLHARGLNIVPAHRHLKRPPFPWKRNQQRRFHPDLLERLMRENAYTYGLLPGALSGVDALDLDSAEALAWAERNLPPTPWRVQTPSGGAHWYYRAAPPGALSNSNLRRLGIEADVRTAGGFLMGPGAHTRKARYLMHGDWETPIAELPPFPVNEIPLPVYDWEPGTDHVDCERCAGTPLDERRQAFIEFLGRVAPSMTWDAGVRNSNIFQLASDAGEFGIDANRQNAAFVGAALINVMHQLSPVGALPQAEVVATTRSALVRKQKAASFGVKLHDQHWIELSDEPFLFSEVK